MQAPTKKTRKPASDLAPIDFATFPIWEYVMDEETFDETYVRPVLKAALPNSGDLFHVSVELTSASGSVRPGCVEFFDGSYRFPGTFVNGELCNLEPRGSETHLKTHGVLDPDIERAWMKQMEDVFSRPFAEIFPIRWRLGVPHASKLRAVSGTFLFTPRKGCEWMEDGA